MTSQLRKTWHKVSRMKVLMLGSGVLGVTAAYVLASRGHQVEVLDRQPQSGAETSFANGGQLSYSHGEPWPTPYVLKKLPGWMLRTDSPLVFRLRADMDMVRWGLRFLRECTVSRMEHNTVNLLKLNLYSRLKMLQIMEQTGLHFDYTQRGILDIYEDEKSLRMAARQVAFQAKFGCVQQILNAEETLRLEPTLAATDRPIAGAVHSVQDAQADAFLYCLAMEKYCVEKLGVVFHHNTTIDTLETDGAKLTAVLTNKGAFWADAYVMALGSYSPLLLAPLGIHLPIYPMKGYSVTLPFNAHSPAISVNDAKRKVVFTKLGDRLRIAGTAELAGYNTRVREDRVKPIVAAAQHLFPKAAWDSGYTSWACLRPSTPTGLPIIGPTPLLNLFLNTGHGTLGWTQTAGSAYLLADMMERRPPEIIPDGLVL